MKHLISIIFISSTFFCCNKSKQQLIEGKWRRDNGCEIIFKNQFYNLTRWNDDLVYNSKGAYYFNENKERKSLTITLVPDLQYIEDDTIILPCENLNVISLNDSNLITQKPTQWVNGIERKMARINITESYKKIKE